MKISGNIVDIHRRKIFSGEVSISDGKIIGIEPVSDSPDHFILPGLIDSHIHIESSMVTPGAFGYAAVKHGTVGVVSDPHEIANVLGWKGIEYMIQDSKNSPVKFWFGAPSCVPATDFETSGASLNGEDIEAIMHRDEIKYLSEMMNFPGVISGDNEVFRKIRAAQKYGKPVDGHAPGLSGEALRTYIAAGISTDHECSTIEEAREKIGFGMKILIREGSAARNLDALKDLFKTDPKMIMLCSDDLHPEMLEERHINKLIAKLISEGFDIFDVIRSATVNPVNHYKLQSGTLKKGERADLIIVDNITKMNVLETWIDGEKVFDRGKRSFTYSAAKPLNNFNCSRILAEDIRVSGKPGKIRVIQAFDGELITKENLWEVDHRGLIIPDMKQDILKIVVKDRYMDAPPAIGFIKGFGLKRGAFAGSVSHDSHNIVSVGTNDEDISIAVNEIVKMKGGLAVAGDGKKYTLKLNIGGIMSRSSCTRVAADYKQLNELVRTLGCSLSAPFMTLSFMALLVIPDLKIGDRGLFDVNKFKAVPLFIR